jgi:general secretion pathway protein D
LFGTYSDIGSRTELIILITPTVVRSTMDVKKTVDDLIRSLDLTAPMVAGARAKQASGNAP